MTLSSFKELLGSVFEAVSGQELNTQLGEALNDRFPAKDAYVKSIEEACLAAIEAGWMCNQGGEGRKFGRVIENTPDTNNLSVDVVDLTSIKGPHHKHPMGEICLIMPIDDTAEFCGHGHGWKVFKPGSAHYPTVTDGRALVLYLLPDGQIEFTE